MPATTLAFIAPSGLTLTVELYPEASDTIANGSGDSCTEATNRKGYYSATVEEALAGWYLAVFKSGSTPVGASWVLLADDTNTYVAGERVAGIEGTSRRLDDLNDLSAAEVNAELLDVVNTDSLVAGVSIAESLRRIGAITSGKLSGGNTDTETVLDYAESANSIVFTVDTDGNRTAVTYN